MLNTKDTATHSFLLEVNSFQTEVCKLNIISNVINCFKILTIKTFLRVLDKRSFTYASYAANTQQILQNLINCNSQNCRFCQQFLNKINC